MAEHIYIYIYLHLHALIIYTYIHAYTDTDAQPCVNRDVRGRICTYIYKHMCAHVCLHSQYTFINSFIYCIDGSINLYVQVFCVCSSIYVIQTHTDRGIHACIDTRLLVSAPVHQHYMSFHENCNMHTCIPSSTHQNLHVYTPMAYIHNIPTYMHTYIDAQRHRCIAT